MREDKNSFGKIMVHGDRAEAPSSATVEERARELAQIDGRSADAVTNEDRQRAKEELLGIGSRDEESGNLVEDPSARDPSEPSAGRSGRVHKEETTDENLAAEEAVLGGVEEAEHEQMLEARRQRSDED